MHLNSKHTLICMVVFFGFIGKNKAQKHSFEAETANIIGNPI